MLFLRVVPSFQRASPGFDLDLNLKIVSWLVKAYLPDALILVIVGSASTISTSKKLFFPTIRGAGNDFYSFANVS